MVKLIRREGKMVLPSGRTDYDKKLATSKLKKFWGNRIKNIKYTPIRKDGTRGVSFKFTGDDRKASYSYLTDIR